jgi:hypothetical protein
MFFNKQFAVLVNAYVAGSKLSGETQDVYWEMLKDISDENFSEGVQDCLASSKFFPTIAELGDASMPPVTDYKAPLPPLDEERPTIGWREQLRRKKKEQERLEQKNKMRKLLR